MSKKSGLSKRQKEIIEILSHFTEDNPITVQTISEKLNLSSRTILREMPQIDTWFEENDFHLVKKPRVGLYVDEDQDMRKFLQELLHTNQNKLSFTREEREERILFEILSVDEPLKYYYFTSLFHISDGTLSSDLDEIEKSMNHYNLTLYRRPGVGIYRDGKEEDYRQMMVMLLRYQMNGKPLEYLLENHLIKEKKIFETADAELLKEVRNIIKETQKVLDVQYTEHSELHLSLYLILAACRLSERHEIEGDEKNFLSMMHLPEYQAANWIGSKIGRRVGFAISEGEIYFIAMQLLSAKIWKNHNDSKYDEENFRTRQIVIKIAVNMGRLLGTDFLENEVLIDGLCNHMRPAINRIKMKMFTENGNLEMLKKSYGNIFHATAAACGFLKKELGVEEIQESEIGFIAMYFCVAMEKKYTEERNFSVYIACPHGVGTSHMLAVHLQKEFPELQVEKIVSTSELDVDVLNEEGIDLIISTTELNIAFPYVYVNSVLLGPDKIMIRSKLKELKKNKNKKVLKSERATKRIDRNDIEYMVILGREILQVLDNIKISSQDTVLDEKDIIRCAGRLFARDDESIEIITKDLIRREDVSSTFIPGMNVLFLHCETKGVKHCRFGYISLKKPLEGIRSIRGAILMLIPKTWEPQPYKDVMSEISGALAERDQILTYLYEKNREAVEAQLENSLGNFYEKMMRKKGGQKT